jgi:hypothetical protein
MDYVFSFGAKWGSWQSISFCCWPLYLVLFFFLVGSWPFSLRPNRTHSYPTHLPTFINTAPTLVFYLLSSTDIITLITNYPTNLPPILTTYPINLATLLIICPIDLTTVLITYLTNLANTLYT